MGTGYDLGKREDTDKMIQECRQQPPTSMEGVDLTVLHPAGRRTNGGRSRAQEARKGAKAAGTCGAAGEGADPGEL